MSRVYQTTDPVRNVAVYIGDANLTTMYMSVSWEWQAVPSATWHSVSIPISPEDFPVTEANRDRLRDLQVLQAAYGSERGLRTGAADHSDKAVIKIYANIDTEDFETWAARGNWNPFDANGLAKWETGQKFIGRHAEEGTVTDDGLELTTGFEVKPKAVSGGIQSLGDWWVNAGNPNLYVPNGYVTGTFPGGTRRQAFDFYLIIPSYAEAAESTIHNFGPYKGFNQWLNSLRADPTTMPEITGQGTQQGGSPGQAYGSPDVHKFQLVNSSGDNVFSFRLYRRAMGIVGGNVNWIHLLGYVDEGEWDHQFLQDRMRLISYAVDTTVYEDNPFGNRDTPARARTIVLSDELTIDAINKVPRLHVKDEGSQNANIIPMGYYRVVDFNDLTPVLDAMMNETHRLMPSHDDKPMMRELHHYGTEDKTLRLLNPEQATRYSGVARPLTIDNQGDGDLDVDDWAGNNVVTLKPNQSADLRFVYDNEGESRLLGKVPFRELQADAGRVGDFHGLGYFSYDANNWAHQINYPGVAQQYTDEDAFELGTATVTDMTKPAGTTWNATNMLLTPDTLKVLKDGFLDFEQVLNFTIVGNGNIPNGSQTVVLRLRNGVLSQVDHSAYYEIAGNGVTRTLRWQFKRRVKKNDIFVPLFIFAKSATINTGSCPITDFNRTATLDQDIAIEYESPAVT